MSSHPYNIREDRRTWAGGVRVIIPDGEGRILLIRQRHRDRDIWLPPGGYVDPRETSKTAAVREAKEETGLDVSPRRLIWHIEDVEGDDQFFVMFWLADILGGELGLGIDPEFDEDSQVLNGIGWFNEAEMSELEYVYPHFLIEELWDELARENAYNIYREGSKPANRGKRVETV